MECERQRANDAGLVVGQRGQYVGGDACRHRRPQRQPIGLASPRDMVVRRSSRLFHDVHRWLIILDNSAVCAPVPCRPALFQGNPCRYG